MLKQGVGVVAQVIQAVGVWIARALRLTLAAPVHSDHTIALAGKMRHLMLKTAPGVEQAVSKKDHLIASAAIFVVVETAVDGRLWHAVMLLRRCWRHFSQSIRRMLSRGPTLRLSRCLYCTWAARFWEELGDSNSARS